MPDWKHGFHDRLSKVLKIKKQDILQGTSGYPALSKYEHKK